MAPKSRLGRLVSLLGGLALALVLSGACAGPTPTPQKPTEVAKTEAPKTEAAKPEAAKPEAAKPGATSPAKQEAGRPRTIGIVSILQAAEGARRMTQGSEEASKVMGWTPVIVDAKGDVAQAANAIDNFVQQKVDAMILSAVPNELAEDSLRKAKAANIPVGNIFAGLYTDLAMQFGPDFFTQGAMMGKFMLQTLGYQGNVVVFSQKLFGSTLEREEAFRAHIKLYPKVKIVADYTPNFAQLVEDSRKGMENILIANPQKGSIDALFSPFDAQLIGPIAAIEAAGRTEIKIFGFDGDIFNLDNMRKGGPMYATVAVPTEMAGWQAIDAINDIFNGKKPNIPTIDSVIITKNNLPPPGKDYQGEGDWRAKFRQKWGR